MENILLKKAGLPDLADFDVENFLAYAQNRSRFVIGSPALLMNLKRINNLIKLQNKKRRFLSVFV